MRKRGPKGTVPFGPLRIETEEFMSIIRTEDLTYQYKVLSDEEGEEREVLKKALRGLSLSVRPGEFIAILGRNGSGKSTILKIITGVLNQTAGDLVINGRISAHFISFR